MNSERRGGIELGGVLFYHDTEGLLRHLAALVEPRGCDCVTSSGSRQTLFESPRPSRRKKTSACAKVFLVGAEGLLRHLAALVEPRGCDCVTSSGSRQTLFESPRPSRRKKNLRLREGFFWSAYGDAITNRFLFSKNGIKSPLDLRGCYYEIRIYFVRI